MKFVTMKEVPNGAHVKYKLDQELTEFMNMNVKCVKVTFKEGEYKNVNTCYTTLYKAVKRWGYPILVTVRKGDLYLIRTDI